MEDFEAVYRRYFGDVYKYTLSLCQDRNLAEEVTQETFFRALRHFDRFRGDSSLFSWLCQIAKNTYFTLYRSQKRTLSGEDLPLPAPDDLEEALLDRDTALRLHRLLHELREPYKEVFALRVFSELPFSQIGELFGKSDSWARLIYYRAKQTLWRQLHENNL